MPVSFLLTKTGGMGGEDLLLAFIALVGKGDHHQTVEEDKHTW